MVSTVAVGALVQSAGIRALFVVLIGALISSSVLSLGLPGTTARHQLARFTGLQRVLRNRLLLSFLGAVLVVWSANTAINAFYSIYLVQIGAPASLIGISWALGAAVEIPLMLVFPQLAGRFGVQSLVLTGAVFMVVRAVTVALVNDPLLVTLTMLLHGAGFALLLVGGVTYVARHAPQGAEATAQGVLAGVAVGLASGIGPGIGGLLASSFGLNSMFGAAAMCGAIGVGGLVVTLRLGPLSRIPTRTVANTPR